MNSYNNDTEKTFVISPKSTETRWVALDDANAIISEGKTPAEAIEEAKKVTKGEYALMFVPIEGNTCFF